MNYSSIIIALDIIGCMENRELCQICPIKENSGDCLKAEVKELLSVVTEINDPDKKYQQAVDVHKEIANMRTEAREKGCLNVNNIDPDYPGKKLL
jgi:protein-tyrosine-phosphatase